MTSKIYILVSFWEISKVSNCKGTIMFVINIYNENPFIRI